MRISDWSSDVCSSDLKPQDSDSTDAAGVRLGARWRAVDAAGLYVPGGRAAYPSSLLMNAIPAKVAGVERITMVTPTPGRSEEHTSELQSLMRSSYAVFLLKKKNTL